jgi:hypothetical protein
MYYLNSLPPKLKNTKMRKLLFILAASTLLLSVAAKAQELPYKAGYSSNFKVASHDLSKMVLELYKGYENNDFSQEASFSDTVLVILPNGQTLQGKEQVIKTFKDQRQTQSNVKFAFDAIIPLTSVDRKENWVALWGSTETSQGKSSFQSTWRISKEKKIDFIILFESPIAQ